MLPCPWEVMRAKDSFEKQDEERLRLLGKMLQNPILNSVSDQCLAKLETTDTVLNFGGVDPRYSFIL